MNLRIKTYAIRLTVKKYVEEFDYIGGNLKTLIIEEETVTEGFYIS